MPSSNYDANQIISSSAAVNRKQFCSKSAKAQSATLLVRKSCKQQLCFKRKSCGLAGSSSQSEQREVSLSTLTTELLLAELRHPLTPQIGRPSRRNEKLSEMDRYFNNHSGGGSGADVVLAKASLTAADRSYSSGFL